MKNILLILLLLVSIIGCQESEPTDYTSALKKLSEKKKELVTLNEDVTKYQKLVEQFDTTTQVKELRSVQTISLAKRDFNHFVEIQSEFKADNIVKVSSEMGGRISGLKLDGGDRVKKGQYIGQVDTEQLEKQLEELNKSLELATDVHERQDRLWKQNIGSEIQYLQAKNNKERLEKTIGSLNLGFRKSKIYAPISGVVEMMSVENGEVVGPGQPLFTISNTNKLKLIASVPETYIRSIKRGGKVKVNIPTLDLDLNTTIRKIGNTIHPNNRTIDVEMLINNNSGYLKPNMLAIMQLMNYENKDVYIIPIEYVQQGIKQDNYVFVVENKGGSMFAKKLEIVTGKAYNNEIEVKEGINQDAKLITIGSKGLIDGEEIKLK